MGKTIRVLKVAPGEHPMETTLVNDLDELQKAVSIGASYQGLIEIIEIEDGVCILCNEEGKLIGLEGNRRISTDIITGVFYVTGEDDDGDLASLPADMIEKYMLRFWKIESFSEDDIMKSIVMKFF